MKLNFPLVTLAVLLVTAPTAADNATVTSNITNTPLSTCAAFDEKSKACGGAGGKKPDDCCDGLVCHPLISGVRLNAKCVTSDMVAQGTVSTNATSPTSNSTSTQSPEPICAALGEKSKECGGVGGKKADKCCEGLICHVDGQNADCIEDPNATVETTMATSSVPVTTATTLAAVPTSAPTNTPTSAPVDTTTDTTVDAITTMPLSSAPAGTTTDTTPVEKTTTEVPDATTPTTEPAVTTMPLSSMGELLLEDSLDGSILHYIVETANPAANGQDTLTISLTVPAQGWVAFAISETGSMIDGEAIIGLPDSGEVKKYNLNDRTQNGVVVPMPDERQTLIDTSIEQSAEGITVLRFTKILDEDGEIPIEIGQNTVLSAYGSSNVLAYHAGRESYTLDLTAATSRTGGETIATSTTEAAATNTASPTSTVQVETDSIAPTTAPSPEVADPQTTEAPSSATTGKLSIGLVAVIGAISAFVI